MKPCPVTGCDSLIRRTSLVCHDHWLRLPDWVKADLTYFYYSDRGSDLHQQAVASAIACLNETAARAEAVG